jgi:hypothetical protein
LRRSGWILRAVAAVTVVVTALVGAGSAFGASRPKATTEASWERSIRQLHAPGAGCYHASYPTLQWHATRCQVAPKWPLLPGIATSSPLVGNGNDYAAEVSGTISQATGSFPEVSPTKISETGQVGGRGSQVSNTFTLQLNTEFFSTPVCSGSSNSKCQGWQQFVYETSSNVVFMQYWLLDWDTTCPSGWYTVKYQPHTFCFTNSPASSLTGSALTAADLATADLEGQATAGGNDQVSLSLGSGQATVAVNSDSMLDLSSQWNTTEFGVFGDGNGSEAKFGKKTTLEAQTSLVATSETAPTCVNQGFTAETNNLHLTTTPVIASQPSPTIVSEQTRKSARAESCVSAAGGGT